MITQRIGLVSLVVDDYDDALAFFIGKLGFGLVEDTFVPEQPKRWVVVTPPGANESRLLLAKASTEDQKSRIGLQACSRVFLFLYTDNFWRDYERYKANGVVFVREPKLEPYGMVAVFKDLTELVRPAGAKRCKSERLATRRFRWSLRYGSRLNRSHAKAHAPV